MKAPLFLTAALAASAALASGSAPAAQEYQFDNAHSHIHLSWNHLGFSTDYANIQVFDGTFLLDEENPEKSSVEVTIDMTSLDTGVAKFNDHLKSADFFNVEKFPQATFTSTKVELTGDKSAKVHGDLTVHGTTKPVVLNVMLNKMGQHPMANVPAAGFSAETQVMRSDFGVGKYAPMVSDAVTISIQTEAQVPKQDDSEG